MKQKLFKSTRVLSFFALASLFLAAGCAGTTATDSTTTETKNDRTKSSMYAR
jgi:ABC-type glycerol-3-phosphate transport system substrate-binding protein